MRRFTFIIFATFNCGSSVRAGSKRQRWCFLSDINISVRRNCGIHVENKVVWEKKGEPGQCSEDERAEHAAGTMQRTGLRT